MIPPPHRSPHSTIARLLPWILVAGLFAFSIAVYSTLPETIPSGLTAAGAPRGDYPRSLAGWLTLPGVALLTAALIAGVSMLIPRAPNLLNIPEKERLLKLPPEYQAPVLAFVVDILAIISAMVVGSMFYAQWVMWRAALGDDVSAQMALLLVGVLCTTPVALILVFRTPTMIRQAESRFNESKRGKS